MKLKHKIYFAVFKIQFKIITPERLVFQDTVDSATLPTAEGEITVLPHHIPLVGLLQAGVVRLKKGGEEILMSVSTGVIEVDGKSITVLADTAERAEELEEEKIEKARADARKLMDSKRQDEESYAEAEASLARELARLKVAKLKRSHARGGPRPQSGV